MDGKFKIICSFTNSLKTRLYVLFFVLIWFMDAHARYELVAMATTVAKGVAEGTPYFITWWRSNPPHRRHIEHGLVTYHTEKRTRLIKPASLILATWIWLETKPAPSKGWYNALMQLQFLNRKRKMPSTARVFVLCFNIYNGTCEKLKTKKSTEHLKRYGWQ